MFKWTNVKLRIKSLYILYYVSLIHLTTIENDQIVRFFVGKILLVGLLLSSKGDHRTCNSLKYLPATGVEPATYGGLRSSHTL